MCAQGRWATDDPLGIGGLLDNAVRLWPLVTERGVERRDLLVRLLREAKVSLRAFKHSSLLNQPPEYRLAFRELGLAIGLHDLEKLGPPPARDAELEGLLDDLRPFAGTAERIDRFWSDTEHRGAVTWTEHQDINDVMLATSLAAHGASG